MVDGVGHVVARIAKGGAQDPTRSNGSRCTLRPMVQIHLTFLIQKDRCSAARSTMWGKASLVQPALLLADSCYPQSGSDSSHCGHVSLVAGQTATIAATSHGTHHLHCAEAHCVNPKCAAADAKVHACSASIGNGKASLVQHAVCQELQGFGLETLLSKERLRPQCILHRFLQFAILALDRLCKRGQFLGAGGRTTVRHPVEQQTAKRVRTAAA
mmetsp:Transcript_68377/g.160302  ORF Transcript_68377/g.160302 Transcript_68377/m.160302 type:complete len:214 (+) Transcript_68377:1173-1814(+)